MTISNLAQRGVTLLAAVLVLCAMLVNTAQAVTPSKSLLHTLKDDTPFYDPNAASCGGSAAVIPTGTLPRMIPEPYNGAFTAGAQRHQVAPALVAALFTEENFTHTETSQLAARWAAFPQQHPDPNSGWPTNEFHTQGAFQFIPGTWAQYGDDGDGDGIKDPQHIADGAAAAANYVAANGATVDKPVASWHDAIFAYNHAEWYVDAVMMYYNFYTNGSSSSDAPATAAGGGGGCASTGGTVTCNNGTANTSSGNLSEVRKKVICLAEQELAQWNNKQLTPATGYLKYSENQVQDWCADFVSWLYNQASYPIGGPPASAWRVAAVSGIQAVGEQNQKFHYHPAAGYTPRPGDMAIHGPNHVNLVTGVNGNRMSIIGGNQGHGPFPGGSSVTGYDLQSFTATGITGFVSPD